MRADDHNQKAESQNYVLSFLGIFGGKFKLEHFLLKVKVLNWRYLFKESDNFKLEISQELKRACHPISLLSYYDKCKICLENEQVRFDFHHPSDSTVQLLRKKHLFMNRIKTI